MIKLKIIKSHLPNKKYDAIFIYPDGKIKTVPFGASHYDDYTLSKNDKKRENYIKRHQVNEDFNNYTSPSSLSRYILWGNSGNIKVNIREFKKRFNLE